MASRATRIPAKRGIADARLDQNADAASKRRSEKPPDQAPTIYKTSIERRLLAAEESQRELERELSQAKANIARLESDRRWLSEREQQEREERQSFEEAWNKERDELTNANRKLRNANLELEGRIGDLEDAYNTLKRTTESSIASQASTLVAAERRVVLLQDELTHANALAFERATTINTLREQVDLLEESRANSSMSMDGTQWAVVRDELKSQAEPLRTTAATNARLTAELNKLRARNQNVEILREEKRDLERKLARLEEYKESAARLQGELEAAKQEREAWFAFMNDPSGEPTASTPTPLTETLKSLRQANASLSEESGSLRGALDHRSAQLQDAERRLSSCTLRIDRLDKSLGREREINSHQARRVRLLEQELSSCRTLLSTFDAADAAFREDTAMVSEDHQKLTQHINELERVLQEYKTANDALQERINEFAGASVNDSSMKFGDTNGSGDVDMAVREERYARNQLESDLAQTSAKLTELEKTIESLQQQLWEAGVNIALGNNVPRNTRVLHIQANPASEHFAFRRQELDRLKGENAALVTRLYQVENSLGVAEDEHVVPWRTWDNLSTEKAELSNTVQQKELRLLRLQQVFKAKAGEFRDATSSILGWKLMFQSTRVRLTSMFDTTASMVFDSIANSDVGTMKLISLGDGGEGGPPNTQNLMQFWVHERSSIPCFLAAMTLECYEQSMKAQQNRLEKTSMDI